MLSKFKKFKVPTVLVLGYKKGNDRKIFHSCTKLTGSDSDIEKGFISMNQSIMTKMKEFADEDRIALDVIIKHGFWMLV